MSFADSLLVEKREAKDASAPLPCNCWDCLRERGLTPPLATREHYQRRYPRTLFGADEDGRPYPAKVERNTDAGKPGVSDQSDIKAAIRNREIQGHSE